MTKMKEEETPTPITKGLILKWLEGKTKDEIADKFIKTMDYTYTETVKHWNLKMRAKLFEELLKPIPEPPKTKWHGLW